MREREREQQQQLLPKTKQLQNHQPSQNGNLNMNSRMLPSQKHQNNNNDREGKKVRYFKNSTISEWKFKHEFWQKRIFKTTPHWILNQSMECFLKQE